MKPSERILDAKNNFQYLPKVVEEIDILHERLERAEKGLQEAIGRVGGCEMWQVNHVANKPEPKQEPVNVNNGDYRPLDEQKQEEHIHGIEFKCGLVHPNIKQAADKIKKDCFDNSESKEVLSGKQEPKCELIWCEHIKQIERGKSSSVQGFYWGYFKSSNAYPQNICEEWMQCPICGATRPAEAPPTEKRESLADYLDAVYDRTMTIAEARSSIKDWFVRLVDEEIKSNEWTTARYFCDELKKKVMEA